MVCIFSVSAAVEMTQREEEEEEAGARSTERHRRWGVDHVEGLAILENAEGNSRGMEPRYEDGHNCFQRCEGYCCEDRQEEEEEEKTTHPGDHHRSSCGPGTGQVGTVAGRWWPAFGVNGFSVNADSFGRPRIEVVAMFWPVHVYVCVCVHRCAGNCLI